MDRLKPDVVIACAWYERADYIHETLDSLLTQTYDNFEVVVVNDGSSDPRVRKILDSYRDPRLRVIHQKNTGFVGAITRAIAASDAPLIAIQGSADISYPDRLRKQVAVLKARPDVAAVACRLDNILDIQSGRKQVYGSPIDGDVKTLALTKIIMMHGEVMYRRDLYDKIGGYRQFFRFSQDRDLWCRFSREGKIVVLEDILYKRYANIGGVSGDPEKQILQRFLSHFAVYCHQTVMNGGSDPLDLYGVQAGLMFQGTLRLQKDMVTLALRYFLADNRDAAYHILATAQPLCGGTIASMAGWLLRYFPEPVKTGLKMLRGAKNAS